MSNSGRLAQLGEHQLDKLGVTGSSPVPPIHVLSGLQRKSCKRVGGAIPIALRSELDIELSLSFCRFASSSPIRTDLESKAGTSLKIDVV